MKIYKMKNKNYNSHMNKNYKQKKVDKKQNYKKHMMIYNNKNNNYMMKLYQINKEKFNN